MIKFSPGAIPKEVGDQICALNESRYHSRPRSPAWRGGGGGRRRALWYDKCITFKKSSGGEKVCPSWLARYGDTVTVRNVNTALQPSLQWRKMRFTSYFKP